MNRRGLGDLVDAVELALGKGDEVGAVAMLVTAEGRAFIDGLEYVAGELAFARFEIGRGDPAGAVEVLRQLTARGRP